MTLDVFHDQISLVVDMLLRVGVVVERWVAHLMGSGVTQQPDLTRTFSPDIAVLTLLAQALMTNTWKRVCMFAMAKAKVTAW